MDLPPLNRDDIALDTMMRTQLMTSELLRRHQLEEATAVIRPAVGHVAWADWDCFDELVEAGEQATRRFLR
jgi:predicted acylesterase/phospholipase RssA